MSSDTPNLDGLLTMAEAAALRSRKPIAKPEPRTRVKGRKDRAETKVKQSVRAKCVERDGDCRFHQRSAELTHLVGECQGESEWAHLGEKRRAKTRGMAPEARHTTAGSLMLCTAHHTAYDAHVFDIVASAKGANAALLIHTKREDYVETFTPREDKC